MGVQETKWTAWTDRVADADRWWKYVVLDAFSLRERFWLTLREVLWRWEDRLHEHRLLSRITEAVSRRVP